MPDITSEQLRDISIRTVEMFLNDKIPLSEGLAKQASEYDLNAEQIQRGVEASNSIAYLKLLKMAEDRTFEFGLAKYSEVLAHMVRPDMSKTASAQVKGSSITKQASTETIVTSSPSYHSKTETYTLLTKLASENARALMLAKDELDVVKFDLQKAASALRRDNKSLEKLSAAGGIEKAAGVLDLESGHYTSGSSIFKESELAGARKYLELEKKASELTAEITKREGLFKQSELAKESFISALSGLAGKAIGTVIGKPLGLITKPIGRAIAAGAKTDASKVSGNLHNLVSKNKVPISDKKGLLGWAGTAGFAGLDASMYQPKAESNVYQQLRNGPY